MLGSAYFVHEDILGPGGGISVLASSFDYIF